MGSRTWGWRSSGDTGAPTPAPALVTKQPETKARPTPVALGWAAAFLCRSGCSCQLSRASSYGDQTAGSASPARGGGGRGGLGGKGAQGLGRGPGRMEKGCGTREGWLGRDGRMGQGKLGLGTGWGGGGVDGRVRTRWGVRGGKVGGRWVY